MRTPDLGKVVELLLRENAPDADLLNRYVQERDERAFEGIVRRHGRLVWAVCNRVLRNTHDAEDAFQAVFLLLVRKARSIGRPELLANWLHGVALKTAVQAKRVSRRRQEKEAAAPPRTEAPGGAGAELREVLDRELARLPEKYRAAIVLCDLEGRTRSEAACLLRLPEGTVASRLSSGRAMLAKRLTRYGLPSGAIAAFLVENVSAAMPKPLVDATLKSAGLLAAGAAVSAPAMVLMEGVLKAMFLTKLKVATAGLLLVGVLGTALGAKVVTSGQEGTGPQAVEPAAAPRANEPQAKAQKAEPKPDLEKMQGYWEWVRLDSRLNPLRGKNRLMNVLQELDTDWMIIQGDRILRAWGNETPLASLRLDESTMPKSIDVQVGDRPPFPGLYSLEGDTLKLCFSGNPTQRPTQLAPGDDSAVFEFRRREPPKPMKLSDFLAVTNAAKFDEQFLHHRFRVTGEVDEVTKVNHTQGGEYYLVALQIVTRNADGSRTFHGQGSFSFWLDDRKQLAGLESGQQVTIEGRCTGKLNKVPGEITFDRCRVISVEK